MDIHSATEVAFRNGYEKGKSEAEKACAEKGIGEGLDGEWIRLTGGLGWTQVECSICKYVNVFSDGKAHKYCPECGACMSFTKNNT